MITPDSTGEDVMSHLIEFLDRQPDQHSEEVATTLKQSAFDFSVEWHPIKNYYNLLLFVPPELIWAAKDEDFHKALHDAMDVMIVDERSHSFLLKIKAWMPDEPQAIGLNNCFFKTEQTLEHDGLRFRSKGEVAIYDELRCRKILFFPNPAAVLGHEKCRNGDKVEKREPDFLICYKGKWGILEVNGDQYHCGPVKTAADHERARKFHHYGLFFVQSYEDSKCKTEPGKVVDEFLRLLENSWVNGEKI